MKIELPRHLRVSRDDAYLVGGSVRDLIRGKTPRDYDIAVEREPDGFARDMASRTGGHVVVLGKKSFAVYRVISSLGCVDVSPFNGQNLRQDLLSRDFTINALACDLVKGRIIDVANGIKDLRAGMIRMVAPSVFEKDPVRLVRAFRMATMPGFHIGQDTLRVIRKHAALISEVAGERVWSELSQILNSPEACRQLVEMQATQVLPSIISEFNNCINLNYIQLDKYDEIKYQFKSLTLLERLYESPETFLDPESAGFVREIAPQTRSLLKLSVLLRHLQPHGDRSVRAIGLRLRMSNKQREWIVSLAGRHQQAMASYLDKREDAERVISEAAGRLFRRCGEMTPHVILRTLVFFLAEPYPADTNNQRIINLLKNTLASYFEKGLYKGLPPVLTGTDLIGHFNLAPSPMIGSLLRRVRELQLSGLIASKAQALEWVDERLKHP